ncbi:MAG: DUF3153 domain-containing protein [Oscillatoriales cyanobacterium RM1_1_9]|nr:DUF3153 domain-containing protein [Oscillatoriales cyanobacterium RM1_1_9]
MKGIRQILIVLVAAFCLTGCVQSSIGVQFQDQTHGQIVQTVRLTEKLSSLSPSAIDEWIRSLNRQVKGVDGQTKRISNQSLQITIPFNNGADLEKKFNQFFNPINPEQLKGAETLDIELPQFSSRLNLTQNNWIFAIRNHLDLELDLRSLSVLSTPENVLIDSGDLLDLEFALLTPWGAHILQPDGAGAEASLVVTAKQNGKRLTWALQPGDVNRIETIFGFPVPSAWVLR